MVYIILYILIYFTIYYIEHNDSDLELLIINYQRFNKKKKERKKNK